MTDTGNPYQVKAYKTGYKAKMYFEKTAPEGFTPPTVRAPN